MKLYTCLLLIGSIVCTSVHARSQSAEWEAITPKLSGGTVSKLILGHSNDVFAQRGTYVARSLNSGVTWEAVSPANTALYDLDLPRDIAAFKTTDGTGLILYSPYGENAPLARTLDNGASWDTIPLDPKLVGSHLMIVGLPNGVLVASVQSKIDYTYALYSSSDNGTQWSHEKQISMSIGSMFSSTDSNVFLSEASGSRFLCRTNSGAILEYAKPPGALGIQRYCAAGSRVYLSSDTDLYFSDDQGGTWNRSTIPSGSASFEHLVGFQDRSVLIVAPLRFNASRTYYLAADSLQARVVQDSSSFQLSKAIAIGPGEILAPSSGYIIHAFDLGKNWSIRTAGIMLARPTRVSSNRGSVLLLAEGGNVYHYQTSSPSWSPVVSLPFEHDPSAITNVLVTNRGTYLVFTTYGVLRSTDSASTWNLVPSADSLLRSTRSFQSANGNILASAESWLWESTDDGETWFRRAYQFKANMTGIGETPDSVLLVCSRHGLNRVVDTELYFLQRTSTPAVSVLSNHLNGSVYGVAAFSNDRRSFEIHTTSDAGYSWRSHAFELPTADHTADFSACSDEYGRVYYTTGTYNGDVNLDTTLTVRRSTLGDAIMGYLGLANGRLIRFTMSWVEELIRPTGVDQKRPSAPGLQVSPSPASDLIRVMGLRDGPVTLSIHDLMGQHISSSIIVAHDTQATLSVNGMTSGCYLLTTGHGEHTMFFVK